MNTVDWSREPGASGAQVSAFTPVNTAQTLVEWRNPVTRRPEIGVRGTTFAPVIEDTALGELLINGIELEGAPSGRRT